MQRERMSLKRAAETESEETWAQKRLCVCPHGAMTTTPTHQPQTPRGNSPNKARGESTEGAESHEREGREITASDTVYLRTPVGDRRTLDPCAEGERRMKEFDLRIILGKGSFGCILLAEVTGGLDKHRMVAIKRIPKTDSRERASRSRRELTALRKLHGQPFITQLYDAFQTTTHVVIVMDYAPGSDLFNSVDFTALDETGIRFYLSELVVALQAVHERGIIHRDLKAENILIDEDGHVILADFGLCQTEMRKRRRTFSYVGTPGCIPPEIALAELRRNGHDHTVDWYALGVLGVNFLSGNKFPYGPPYTEDVNTREWWNKVLREMRERKPPFIPEEASPHLRHLLKGLLAMDSRQRLGQSGAEEVKRHPFFKGINWDDVVRKKLIPPFIPRIQNDFDTEYFKDSRESLDQEPVAPAPPPNVQMMYKGFG